MKQYLDSVKLQEFTTKLTNKYKSVFATKAEVGSPLTAYYSADMTDKTKIYVYTGHGSLNNGHWYYYDSNNASWKDGGVYNSTAFTTDPTLTIQGQAADAKAVGDAIASLSVPADLHIEATSDEDPNTGMGSAFFTFALSTTRTMDELLTKVLAHNSLSVSGGIIYEDSEITSDYPTFFQLNEMKISYIQYVPKEKVNDDAGETVTNKDALKVEFVFDYACANGAITRAAIATQNILIYEDLNGDIQFEDLNA